MSFAVRRPAVAGRFYPQSASELSAAVEAHLGQCSGATPAAGVLLPHAGYVYSGTIAGRTLARVDVPPTTVVIGPNHTGAGARRAVWPNGSWQLPGGALEVDAAFAEELVKDGVVEPDLAAHLREHSIEVELPFLRARRPDVAIVPICLAHLTLSRCLELGSALARAVVASRARGREVLLVASSDMSHYVPAHVAEKLDQRALAAVAALDAEALYSTVVRDDISMCGFVPATVVVAAARALGAEHGDIVAYGNSGDTSGDRDRVVGYAGAIFRTGSTRCLGLC
ncbi:MAG: AmmeMemoRadiSam system protein B [Polyangiaceae bacterium]|nr:AmmeMemoRadiSam system protein B [Polyangiaceae bacterium]